ncbi:MAG TPA: TRAP transporter small permease [Ferrovibrio sp.]|uniref:TRAP transporter small permease n=1 Tax=Ferrovibrio sp. TaxID=1917215 RepID=UPI002ED59FE1
MIEKFMNRLEEGLLILLLSAMTLLTFSQVVLRYIFNTGWGWALEATTYMFGWLVMVGISYGIKVGFHIGVDAVVNLMPRQGRRIIGLLTTLLCLAYAGLLTYGAYQYFDTMHMLGVEAEDIPLPRWLLVSIMPIGFALLGIRLLQVWWKIVTGKLGGFNLGDEAAEVLRAHAEDVGGEQAR